MAQHRIWDPPSSELVPPNSYGGAGPWTSNHYISDLKTIQRPWHDQRNGRESKDRIIAFDWIPDHDVASPYGQGMLALRPNREIDVLRASTSKPLASISARNDMSILFEDLSIAEPRSYRAPVAPKASYEHINGANAEDFGPLEYEGETETIEGLAVTRDSPIVGRLLASSTIQSTRCRQGYLFDCEKNMSIVSGNWQLERLWEIINRFREQSAGEGMLYDGLDLSYIGVSNIWAETIGNSPHRRTRSSTASPSDAIIGLITNRDLPAFEGERTSFPEHRQLCLALCGWKFTIDDLEAECQDLIERGLYYQAIVQAVLHGCTHIALNILRTLIRTRTIQESALGALLASDTINEEQREMCRWKMADTEDPALKALLTYLIEGNWRDVMKTNYLHLGYRVALGLTYLNDTELSGFLQSELARAVKNGDLEGILLTGLTEQAMDLFQTYIVRTNDLQTAVLAMAFTNPLYVDDVRWEMWKETYFNQMQAWRCFVQRTKFTVQHNRMARTREGRTLVETPPGQVTLRCMHCSGDLGLRKEGSYLFGYAIQTNTVRIAPPPAIVGTVCPTCGRHMPRCGICQMWLGTPNPATAGGNRELNKAEDIMAKLMAFCTKCGHGFHADHARSWFVKHSICPVPDCTCDCGLGS
jgi:WD repeat-containing protein mio